MSRRQSYESPFTRWGLYGALAITAGVLVGYVGLGWDLLAAYLCAVNLVTLVFFGLDKWFAQRKAFRIPEAVLFGLVAAGGTPLGFVARQLFRQDEFPRRLLAHRGRAAGGHRALPRSG